MTQVMDNPPPTRFIQLPHATALILTRKDADSAAVIEEIIVNNWKKYFTRVQHIFDFLEKDSLNDYYPSIDRHGRIVFAPKLEAALVTVDSEIERRIGLLKCSTTSFVLRYNVDSKATLLRLLEAVKPSHIFETSLVDQELMPDWSWNSTVSPDIVKAIYTEINARLTLTDGAVI
jgi:hypothetical protein